MENQTPEVVLPPQKPKSNFALWVVVGIAILAVGIGIGVIARKFFQPISSSTSSPKVVLSPIPSPATVPVETVDPTANWKTYINNEFYFSIKYDPSFSPNQIAESVQQLALISFGSMKNNGFEIEISTGDNIDYYKNRIIDQGEKINKEEKITVDGVPATKLTYKQVIVINKFDVSKVIITKNNRDYIITALTSDVDQILSTFKFIGEKTLNAIYTVTLPNYLELMNASTNIVRYGFQDVEYLEVTNYHAIQLTQLKPRSQCGNLTAGSYCLGSDVTDITVGGVPAKSFYIDGGTDISYRVVQTTQAPILEFKMYIAGGGLDQRFQDFISSLTFIK